ncbi:Hypothetical Protein FCC1311_031482 [Hondaea fermentalgiana]|uniref:DUF218 domain-containing protein n=1 Tax=Hondaea fermentalgiana TaxID=2315210 RepID=A0A2R5G8Q6_9STRA|nr:Hypothetical Protein FCC1311_031482 [Hondaea fermentalgiana]|eukprot:GBG26925.1 Hypothetical Protein FCC1311_031482 [Hondaea fermentalgiana]
MEPDMRRIMVVLGQQLNPDGSMTKILKDRCTRAAIAFEEISANEGLKTSIIVSGGGVEKVGFPESKLMRENLVEGHGLPDDCVHEEGESTTTAENATNVKRMLDEDALGFTPREILLVTSKFHMPRAHYLFEREFNGDVEIREVIASDAGLPKEDGDLDGHINQYSVEQRYAFEAKLLEELRAADEN